MGLRQSMAGIKGAGRDARVVVPNRSVDRAFYILLHNIFVRHRTHTRRDPSLLLCTAVLVVEGNGFFRGLKVIPA